MKVSKEDERNRIWGGALQKRAQEADNVLSGIGAWLRLWKLEENIPNLLCQEKIFG